MRHKKPRRLPRFSTGEDCLGVRLIPGTTGGTWFGTINGNRFVIRRSAANFRGAQRRTFSVWLLPQANGQPAAAEGDSREAIVAWLIEKFKRRLPDAPAAA